MKNLFILLFLLPFQIINANNLEKLQAVNKEWNKQTYDKTIINSLNASNFSTKEDAIKTHLLLVTKILKERTIKLSATQLKNRNKLLAILAQYANAKTFPINNLTNYTTPIFIDKANTHCAVGYLMQQSGFENLAQEINKNERLAYISQIKTQGVQAWAQDFGFTLAELAWIQPGYPSTNYLHTLANGVNGPVFAIQKISSNDFIIGGKFSKELKNNATCNNIAWASNTSGTWEIKPIGGGLQIPNGVDDTVFAITPYGNNFAIGGAFLNANGTNANRVVLLNLASSIAPFSNLGSLPATVKALTVYNGKLIAGGSFSNLIKVLDNNIWGEIAPNPFLYGKEVRAFANYDSSLIIGGDFELLTGALRTYACRFDYTNGFRSMGFGCTTPVNCFEVYNDTLYAGCDMISYLDTNCLNLWNGLEWRKKLKNPSSGIGIQNGGINKMQASTSGLYIFGNFDAGTGIVGNFGKHAGLLQNINGNISVEGILNTNAPIYTAINFNSNIIVGGSFTENYTTTGPISNIQYPNSLGIINAQPQSIKTKKLLAKILEYNFTQHALILAQKFTGDFAIIDMLGKSIKQGILSSNKIDVSTINSGNYILNITKDNKIIGSQQFYKN